MLGHWFPPRQRVLGVTATDTVVYLEMLYKAVLVLLVRGPYSMRKLLHTKYPIHAAGGAACAP